MLTTLPGIAVKFIKRNKAITAASVISVMISISLIVTMFMLVSGSERAMQDELRKQYGDAHMQISYHSQVNRTFTKDVVDRIAGMDDIRQISPVLLDYTIVENSESPVYTLGLDNSPLSQSRYHYTQELGFTDVIMNEGLANSLGIGIGDTLKVSGQSYQLIDIFSDIVQSSTIPDVLFMAGASLKSLLNVDYEATYLLAELSDSGRGYEFISLLHELEPEITVDLFQEDEMIKANREALKGFITVFSALVFMMCGCLLNANFQTFLYYYRKQFATIRSIGGSAWQTFSIVLMQSAIMNAVGVLLGILGSFFIFEYFIDGLAGLLSMEASGMMYDPRYAFIVVLIGFVVIELFMLVPAIRAARILPVQIAEENEMLESRGKAGKVVSFTGIGLSMVILLYGIASDIAGTGSVGYGLVSSIVLLLSGWKLFSYYIKDIMRWLLPLFRKVGGKYAYVAIETVIPQVRKSMVVIISLSMTILIAVWGGSFFDTLARNDENYLKSQFALDIVITPRGGTGQELLSPAFRSQLAQLPDISQVVMLSMPGQLYVENQGRLDYLEYSFVDMAALLDSGIMSGLLTGTPASGTVLITQDFASQNQLQLGDTFQVAVIGNKAISDVDIRTLPFDILTVGGIIDDFHVRPGVQVFLDFGYEPYKNQLTGLYKALVKAENTDAALQQMEGLQEQYPQIKWATLEQALDESRQLLFQRWFLFIAIMIAVMLFLLLGLMNTLMNNINARRKEYAILRSIHVGKKGMIIILLSQVLIYVLLGAVLGLVLGVITSYIIFITESFTVPIINLSLPLAMIGVIVLVSLAIFLPFASKLANRSIAAELRLENG